MGRVKIHHQIRLNLNHLLKRLRVEVKPDE